MATTVLVIDDDVLVRTLIRDTLKRVGFTVLEAADGTEGLARARLRQPDVILLDAVMPVLDGFATCERLKADPVTRPIPVIFMTSSPERAFNRRAYTLGALACLAKPLRREALLAMIEVALAHHAPESQPPGP